MCVCGDGLFCDLWEEAEETMSPFRSSHAHGCIIRLELYRGSVLLVLYK